jgi:hypothetical protein
MCIDYIVGLHAFESSMLIKSFIWWFNIEVEFERAIGRVWGETFLVQISCAYFREKKIVVNP